MTQQTKYPFKLESAFFARVALERIPQLPDEEFEIQFSVQGKTVEEQFPDVLEVQLKVQTLGEQPVTIDAIVVGKFILIEGAPEPDPSIIQRFLDEQALCILWAYLDQMVVQMTAQMGIKPIRLLPSPEFSYG